MDHFVVMASLLFYCFGVSVLVFAYGIARDANKKFEIWLDSLSNHFWLM